MSLLLLVATATSTPAIAPPVCRRPVPIERRARETRAPTWLEIDLCGLAYSLESSELHARAHVTELETQLAARTPTVTAARIAPLMVQPPEPSSPVVTALTTGVGGLLLGALLVALLYR